MSEIELMVDLHIHSQRQGPGSKAETLKALGFMNLPGDRKLKVADIGCGTGGQTITLAQNLNADVTAVDLFPEFLQELSEKSQRSGLKDRITKVEQSMESLPFEKETFDIIWSEGAIYNIGFERGIKEWKDFLKIGGYLAVSEITWITNSRPRAIEDFWQDAYPEIDIASNKIKLLEDNGYSLAGYFYLEEESWIDTYYKPMETRFEAFLARNKYSAPAMNLVKEHKDEIDLYMRYKDFFSYGFYVARRNE